MTKISSIEMEKELIALTIQLLAETGEPYKREIKLNDSLQRQLGIDSMGRAELFQRIEKRFSLALPDRLLVEVETLSDIVNYLQDAKPRMPNIVQQTMVHSHGVSANVNPLQAETLIDLLLLYAEAVPNKPHVYFQTEEGQEEVLTYGQLLSRALQIAGSLRARGLQEGDTVAIMLPTDPIFFATFFGILLAGGTPVPIYPPFRAHMLEAYAKTEARILMNAEVRMLVTFTEAEKLSRLLKAFVPSLKSVMTAYELLQPTEVASPFIAQADSFAFIQYTSGSTSDPKGVLLTHANLLSNITAYGRAIKVTPEDVAVSWLPLYHDMGLIGAWLGSLYHGVPLILMTPFSFLNHPERWLWAIHYHRGTVTGAPNFAYELCTRKIDPAKLEGLDLSSWRVAANGAEKVYPRTLEDFTKRFAYYGLKQNVLTPMYGLAETAVALTIPPIEQPFHVDYVNREQFEAERLAVPAATMENALSFVDCGVPLEGHEIRIVDENDQLLPDRHIGNLQFRGPSSMQGYYRNPVATAAVMHDGWIDTGDLAYQVDGALYVTGRRKDLIIKAGRNLYPVEIEELVGKVAGVRKGCVAAFGLTDHERGTEQLIVVAETAEKNNAKRDMIILSIKEVVAEALDLPPDHVVLVRPHVVPKTSSGKLQRAACKKLYQEDQLGKWRVPVWLQVSRLFLQMLLRQSVTVLIGLTKLIYTFYMLFIFIVTLIPVYLIIRVVSATMARSVCRWWCRGLLWLSFCRINVVGRQYMQSQTRMIFAANHASYIDALVLLALMPDRTRFVGKKELFTAPIFKTFMRKLGFLSVDRVDSAKGLADAKEIEGILKAGDSIVIFPEGTFGYASGLRPFRLGAFKIAAETAVPVCPVALAGTRNVLRDNEKLMWPGRISVTLSEPLTAKGTEWQDITRLRNEVRAVIARYCGETSLGFIAAQTVAPNQTENFD